VKRHKEAVINTENGAGIIRKAVKKSSFFTTTLPLFMLAHFGHHLMTALPGVLLPFIRDDHTLSANGLSNSQVALVTMAFSLAYGFGQLPGGWLADRIGRRPMLAVGIFGVALVGILVGLSNSMLMLLLLLVLMGIVGGGYHPAATPWISAAAGEKNQGRAIGFHFTGGGAGYFLAPFIGAAIAAAWGWHMSFIVMAAPCALFGIIFFFILRRQKESSYLKAVADPHHAGAAASRDRWKPLISLMVLSFITGGLGSVMVFFSLYLVDEFHMVKQNAVFMVAIASFAGVWAGPIAGWMSDRLGRLPIIILNSIIGGAIIFGFRWISPGAGMIALLFLFGVSQYVGAPVCESFILGQTSTRHRSFIYGVYYMVGTGSSLLTPLTGLLTEKVGYQSSFLIAGASSMVVSVICGSILWSTRGMPSQVTDVSQS
jgi:MFS family permease